MEGMDTPETLKTIRAPVVLKMTGSAMPKIYRVSQKKNTLIKFLG